MASTFSATYQQITRKVTSLHAKLGTVRDGRIGHEITLVAVSKGQPVESIEALYSLGHRDFGENYVQELVEKAERLRAAGCDEIRWHFIGHLQTNKVKTLVPWVHAVHAVDSDKLAAELAKRWREEHGEKALALPIFIEVNLDGEPSKSGVTPEEAPVLAAKLAGNSALALQGLMAIPAATSTPEQSSAAFARLRELEQKCRPHTRGQLSMGMSADYELAIPQGATHVRIGTALFGKRE
jgi:pyridoxal phosphate enzyme (YggS family)